MSGVSRTRRRWLAPEVVQSSAMDCGPAALQSLLQGFGIRASYGRLREACQTSVDGSSIDSLEDVARQLGLEVEQTVVPVDHVLLSRAHALPAIVVVLLPGGMMHFVVAWRTTLGRVQVMDPGTGRRWPSLAAFQQELFVHEVALPAEAWREWAQTQEFLAPLQLRLQKLGLGARSAAWLERALADPRCASLARLDAATRMLTACVQAKCVRRGAEAAALMETLLSTAAPAAEIPDEFWSAREQPADAAEDASVLVRGAVLLRAVGRAEEQQQAAAEPRAVELDAALHEPRPRPVRQLLSLLRQDGWRWAVPITLGLLALAVGRMIELLLLRGLMDLADSVPGAAQRLLALGALLGFMGLLAALEFPIATVTMRIARRLEFKLRIVLLEKLPRLGDRYFRSRAGSDLAERAHSLRHVRSHAALAEEVLYLGLRLVLTVAGLVWIAPQAAPLALVAALVALAVPAALQPFIAERDLRVHSHTGALLRFPLDALLGLLPIRCHSAERAIESEHADLLREWARAGRSLLKAHVWADGLQLAATFAVVAWLLFDQLGHGRLDASLLFVYWALEIPALGASIADVGRRYPVLRTITLRALEPLGAVDEHPQQPPGSEASPARGAVAIEMQGVDVVAGGQQILSGVDLGIAPGEHVAVVGLSGAGKSTLLGLLLGWHQPASGTLRVDGLERAVDWLEPLRAATLWIDPQVQLWNRSLLDNVRYASTREIDMERLLELAGLHRLIGDLPHGWQTQLGENGRSLSGGEAQRVRLARGLARANPRLVLLDEAFRGLDRAERKLLLAGVRQRCAQATLLCATHDLEHTLSFPRVLVVRDGMLVEDGDPQVLARRPSEYRALLAAEYRLARAPLERSGWRRVGLAELRAGGNPHASA